MQPLFNFTSQYKIEERKRKPNRRFELMREIANTLGRVKCKDSKGRWFTPIALMTLFRGIPTGDLEAHHFQALKGEYGKVLFGGVKPKQKTFDITIH